MTFSHRRIFKCGVRILLEFLTDGYLLDGLQRTGRFTNVSLRPNTQSASWLENVTLNVSLEKTKEKTTKKDNLLSSNTLNMIQIKMLMKFKVIFFSRNTVEGDESFKIGQFLLIQNRKKVILMLPDSCPVLTARVWIAHRERR